MPVVKGEIITPWAYDVVEVNNPLAGFKAY